MRPEIDSGMGVVPAQVTVLVPAYNEVGSIAETIESLQLQTVPPAEIIVIDDGSDDGTGELARSLGVTVLRPQANTGSKAGAQTFALPCVRTELVMAVDADTTLARDAIEKLLEAMSDEAFGSALASIILPPARSFLPKLRLSPSAMPIH